MNYKSLEDHDDQLYANVGHFVHNEAKRQVRRMMKWPALIFILFALFVSGVVGLVNHRAEERNRDASVIACQSSNLERARTNLSNTTIFVVLSDGARRESVLAKTDKKNSLVHRRSAESFYRGAVRETLVDFTDCRKQADAPTSYRVPTANPIGDPRTGKITPTARDIIKQSLTVVQLRTIK